MILFKMYISIQNIEAFVMSWEGEFNDLDIQLE